MNSLACTLQCLNDDFEPQLALAARIELEIQFVLTRRNREAQLVLNRLARRTSKDGRLLVGLDVLYAGDRKTARRVRFLQFHGRTIRWDRSPKKCTSGAVHFRIAGTKEEFHLRRTYLGRRVRRRIRRRESIPQCDITARFR